MARYLIVANQTAASAELSEYVKSLIVNDQDASFVLLSPANPATAIAGTSGPGSESAADTLSAAEKHLVSLGAKVSRATLGDRLPLKAVEDELAGQSEPFKAIILSTLPAQHSQWLALDQPRLIEQKFGLPVIHVVCDSVAVTPQASKQDASQPGASGAGPTSVSSEPIARTLTFSVQIGSGGYAIAQAVAERLGYRYCDWEVTSRASREAGVSSSTVASAEHSQSLVSRMMERYLASSIYLSDTAELTSATMDLAIHSLTSDDYRAVIEGVVQELNVQGKAVIVGHASQVVLQQRTSVLKVLIYGSPKRRSQRVAQEEGLTPDNALEIVNRSDADRISFFKQVYRVDLLDARLYDLAINTDYLDSSAAVDMVLAAAQAQIEPSRITMSQPRHRT